MAANRQAWVKNLYGFPEPMLYLGKFQAGSTQAIKRGEILEFTGDTNSAWVPWDSTAARTADAAVAAEEIKAGDRAGYYNIIVPRPGDVFEFELATAAAVAFGTALYYSSSQKVTTSSSGTAIGYAVGQEHYPAKQGHLADDAGPDAGTSIRTTAYVRMTFKLAASLWAGLSV